METPLIDIDKVNADLLNMMEQEAVIMSHLQLVRSNIEGLKSVINVWHRCEASNEYFNYVSAVVDKFKEIKANENPIIQ
jgi:hypothetical protein